MSKAFNITQEEVATAWKAVRQAGGGAGYDNQQIADVQKDLANQLYKIWNRMASGSYQAQNVLLVDIPKAKGGTRRLGIPTVTDRIAQTVIKNRLETIIQPKFHEDSYAYQAGKDAIDAVTRARERCMKTNWAVEIDIKGFFDNIDHELLMEMIKIHTSDRVILLYAEKFLKAKGQTSDGEMVAREKGTPQGGVVSPVLANLYLHEAFDDWMKETMPDIGFERYADDILVHCVSEKQANYVKDRIAKRFKEYKLELHPDKTRIVYTGSDGSQDGRGHKCPRKFVFLGYEFKPRRYKGTIVFTPGLGSNARLMIREKIKKLNLTKRLTLEIEEIAEILNPKIMGWINYYGHYRRSELYKMGRDIDGQIVKWLKRKCKKLRGYKQAWEQLSKLRKEKRSMFCHWHIIKLTPTRAV